MTDESTIFTEIFNESDVRILVVNKVIEIEFRIEANVEGKWQYQATAHHVKPALALADKLVAFMIAR